MDTAHDHAAAAGRFESGFQINKQGASNSSSRNGRLEDLLPSSGTEDRWGLGSRYDSGLPHWCRLCRFSGSAPATATGVISTLADAQKFATNAKYGAHGIPEFWVWKENLSSPIGAGHCGAEFVGIGNARGGTARKGGSKYGAGSERKRVTFQKQKWTHTDAKDPQELPEL